MSEQPTSPKKSCPRRFFSTIIKFIALLFLLQVIFTILNSIYIRTLRPPTSWKDYENEWALITGASYGIGEGFAHSLAKRGLNLILVSRTLDKLELVKKNIIAKYPKIKIKTIACDVTEEGYVEKILPEIKSLNISVLINNVGGVKVKKERAFYDNELSSIDYDIKINAMAPLKMTNMILPIMKQRNKGRILSVASAVAYMGTFRSVYGSSKSLLITWSESIQQEFVMQHLDGVSAVVSVTGLVRTPALESIANERLERLRPFFVSPEEYAEAELDLYGTYSRSTAHWKHELTYYFSHIIHNVPTSISGRLRYNAMKEEL